MAQKFVHKISPELIDDAQFRLISDIPSAALTQGTTVLLYPGTYAAMTLGADFDDIALIGVGDKDEIIVSGITVANTTANTLTFENFTVDGGNVVATSDSVCVEFTGTTTDQTVSSAFRRMVFKTAEHAIRYHGTGGSMTLEYCDASGVDQAIVSNIETSTNIYFSRLNSGSNAYFASGESGNLKTVTITASQSGGANAANDTNETVNALIS